MDSTKKGLKDFLNILHDHKLPDNTFDKLYQITLDLINGEWLDCFGFVLYNASAVRELCKSFASIGCFVHEIYSNDCVTTVEIHYKQRITMFIHFQKINNSNCFKLVTTELHVMR